jgi:tagatose 6-phosphate kinase
VILVAGFNPAIDRFAEADRVEPGAVLRLRNVRAVPGGKGLHVAFACATLGEPTTLVGIIDESSRAWFDRVLLRAGIAFVGVPVDQPIRTCYAVRDSEGRTTELLEPGPMVSERNAGDLMEAFAGEARAADVVVLSGSLPPGLGVDAYARAIGATRNDRVLLDASGDALAASLGARPLLVKPNRAEAAHLVGFGIDTWDAASQAAALIGARGPRIVVVSLGAGGAVMWTSGQGFRVEAPLVDARNAVGAGDCLLGGFAVGLVRGWSVEECARYAVACGSAKVLHPETGVLRAGDVDALLPLVGIARTTAEPPR